MEYKQSLKNFDHREVFGLVQQAKDIQNTCRTMFQWLEGRYEIETDFKAVIEDDGNAICITTPAGEVRSRVLMLVEDSQVFARIIFLARLDPSDRIREIPVFALTVGERYSVVAGDIPGRAWSAGRRDDPWGSTEALALGYDLLAGQLTAASQLLLTQTKAE